MDRHNEINRVIHSLELENKRARMDWSEERFKASATTLLGKIWAFVMVTISLFTFVLALLIPSSMVATVINTGMIVFFAALVIGLPLILILGDRPEFRLVLAQDRLIEYGLFNRIRIFTYEQIYTVGRLKSEPYILYYGYDAKGKLDYEDRREARLLSTMNNQLLVNHLNQRMVAQRPVPKSTFGNYKPLILLLIVMFTIMFGLLALAYSLSTSDMTASIRPIVGLLLAVGGSAFLISMIIRLGWMQRSGLEFEHKKKQKEKEKPTK